MLFDPILSSNRDSKISLPQFNAGHCCFLLVLLAVTVTPCLATPPTESPTALSTSPVPLAGRIADEREDIQFAELNAQPNARLGFLWATLAADYQLAADFIQAEDAYNRSLQLLKSDPKDRSNYATTLSNLGNLYLHYARLDEAATCLKKALAIRLEVGDPVKVALTRQHLADLALAQHKFKVAETEASQTYETLAHTEVINPTALSSSLVTLSYARCRQKKCEEGLQNAQQALSIARASLPFGSLQAGLALFALGFAQWKSSGDQQPDNPMLQGIGVIKSQIAPGDPVLFYALRQYREYLKTTHRTPELRQVDLDLSTSAPRPCQNCTISVRSLSNSLR